MSINLGFIGQEPSLHSPPPPPKNTGFWLGLEFTLWLRMDEKQVSKYHKLGNRGGRKIFHNSDYSLFCIGHKIFSFYQSPLATISNSFRYMLWPCIVDICVDFCAHSVPDAYSDVI
jgi:hypothetical protein